MNMTKKINVNFSSLVGLKAELLRKQVEVNEARLKTETVNVPPLSSKKKSKKSVVGGAEGNVKRSVDPEDIVAHKKSKLMLEAKARLYERLKKSKNNDDKFLVDFENKLSEPSEEVDEAIDEEYPIEPEENWVEYQDCFGRTRKCLREDLPHMQRKDDLIKQEVMKKHFGEDQEEEKQQYSVQEKEPEIEIMRRKWEEQTRKLADKVDIHYQDILFDEARAHGVGYYAFSQNEEERAKQQENLTNLRKETERKQRETREVKELKERMEQNRLKAARIRQRIRAGLPAEPTEEELAQEKLINLTKNVNTGEDNESTETDKEKSDEKADRVSVSVDEFTESKETNDEDKIRAFGELLGKRNHWHVMSQEEWVDKCRTQRISKFGPVYDNFTSAGLYNSSRSVDERSTHKEKSDDADTYNSRKSIEESNDNLQNRGDGNNSVGNETVSIVRDSDSQNDKNTLLGHLTADRNSHELSESTIDPTLVPAMTLPQRQATVSYPLSHLSSNYSRDVRDYAGYTPEQQKQTDDMNIPLPGENDVLASSTSHTDAHESLPQSINEDNIMAGLKYLREKFEANHSKCT
ncbi:PREDICTED: coiled-coil domain-containing protein 174 [Vollenhovia emeryi]|uniref:coiled-coil domain-containing protein 174 n=1 Tax=Vollenhovia emeryi TaxID=411798 RepID=UPI0005F4E85D|nr:PREDICTED: coiled-coil domain-containing protein 174 [Vollenhovia emeryi]XP_011860955.1 PREDICTED: coiled-coil domain-containing protein 174 [Vollenhovia emeryi]XP_011860957.1 PREDICTED: coiled-coil domain-containing protein 174 [Vollenhovia emeryi]